MLSDCTANDLVDVANIPTSALTFSTPDANTVAAGSGIDWHYYGKDHKNRKPTDLLI